MPSALPLPLSSFNAVGSSSVAKVTYDSGQAILQVEFRDRTVYQYVGVPATTYQDLRNAGSKGAYFNQHIRNRFAHIQVTSYNCLD